MLNYISLKIKALRARVLNQGQRGTLKMLQFGGSQKQSIIMVLSALNRNCGGVKVKEGCCFINRFDKYAPYCENNLVTSYMRTKSTSH